MDTSLSPRLITSSLKWNRNGKNYYTFPRKLYFMRSLPRCEDTAQKIACYYYVNGKEEGWEHVWPFLEVVRWSILVGIDWTKSRKSYENNSYECWYVVASASSKWHRFICVLTKNSQILQQHVIVFQIVMWLSFLLINRKWEEIEEEVLDKSCSW